MEAFCDVLTKGLEIIIVGINPGMTSATQGHHYAGPGNHFWPCLFQSGLITEPLTAQQDRRIVEFGIGLTNICNRPTKSSTNLTSEELKQGGVALRQKLVEFAPKIAVFNGKVIYEHFSGLRPGAIKFGLQDGFLINSQNEKTLLFVMPSSSPRCSNYPRASDKLPFYMSVKQLRDELRQNKKQLSASSHAEHEEVNLPHFT